MANNNKGSSTRPPLPPFTLQSAIEKVRLAEDGWNTRDPQKVALAYTVDSKWRNRSQFINGREEIIQFLTSKWQKETQYRLIKELWCYTDNKIAVRFVYEWYDTAEERWWRSHGNENWYFEPNGEMSQRHASINDVPIKESERLIFPQHPQGRRPDDHPGLTELGL